MDKWILLPYKLNTNKFDVEAYCSLDLPLSEKKNVKMETIYGRFKNVALAIPSGVQKESYILGRRHL